MKFSELSKEIQEKLIKEKKKTFVVRTSILLMRYWYIMKLGQDSLMQEEFRTLFKTTEVTICHLEAVPSGIFNTEKLALGHIEIHVERWMLSCAWVDCLVRQKMELRYQRVLVLKKKY